MALASVYSGAILLGKSHAREARERRHERETARFHVSRGAHRSPISKWRACCLLAAMISLAVAQSLQSPS